MTFTPAKDLAEHVRLIAVYDDGSEDAFAVPECTLQQGPSAAGIARLVAGEWQRDGFMRWIYKAREDCRTPLAVRVCADLKRRDAPTIEGGTATKEPVDSGATRAVGPANHGHRSPFFLAPSGGRHNPHTPPGGNWGHACARDIGVTR